MQHDTYKEVSTSALRKIIHVHVCVYLLKKQMRERERERKRERERERERERDPLVQDQDSLLVQYAKTVFCCIDYKFVTYNLTSDFRHHLLLMIHGFLTIL